LAGKNVSKYQNLRVKNGHRFPEHIVDGDLNFNRDGEKLYHSHGGRPDTWLEVQLPKSTALKEVKFYNRGDGGQDAIVPYKLLLLDSDRKTLNSFDLTKENLQVFNVTGKASEKKLTENFEKSSGSESSGSRRDSERNYENRSITELEIILKRYLILLQIEKSMGGFHLIIII
jgi:hypothetical protein